MKRLAEGKTTVLSLSPNRRYLFRDDGVHHVPKGAIHNMPNMNYYDDTALVLYDLNHKQSTIEESVSWPHIIVSSPRWSSAYSQWENQRSHSNARFVMNTWSWPEMHFIQ